MAFEIGSILPLGSQTSRKLDLTDLVFQQLTASGAFKTSDTTLLKLAQLEENSDTISARLNALADLREKWDAFVGAASDLRSIPTELGSEVSIQTRSQTQETLTLDGLSDLQTGDKVSFPSGFPGAISANTPYYIRVTDSSKDEIAVYASRADALADTNRLDISSGNFSGATLQQIVPKPQERIKAFFDAYNNLQQSIESHRGGGGALAGEHWLAGLGSELNRSMLPALGFSGLSPAIKSNSGSRELTLDADVLTSQISSSAQNIAEFFEGGTVQGLFGATSSFDGLANSIHSSAGSITTRIEASYRLADSESARITAQIAAQTSQAELEESSKKELMLKVGAAFAASQRQAQFLTSLFV